MSKTINIPYHNVSMTRAGGSTCIDAEAFAREVNDPTRDLADLPSRYMHLGLLAYRDGEVVLSPRGEDLLASIDSIPDDPKPEPAKVQPCRDCKGTGEQVLFVSKHACDGCGGTGDERNRLRRMAKSTAGLFNALVDSGRVASSATMPVVPDDRVDAYEIRLSSDAAFLHTHDAKPYDLRGTIGTAPRYPAFADMTPAEMERWNADIAKLMAAQRDDIIPYGVFHEIAIGPHVGYRVTKLEWQDAPVAVPTAERAPWVLIDSVEVARQFVGKRVEIDAKDCPHAPQHEEHGNEHLVVGADDNHLHMTKTPGWFRISWFMRGNVRLRFAE